MNSRRPDRAYFYSFYSRFVDSNNDLVDVLGSLYLTWERNRKEYINQLNLGDNFEETLFCVEEQNEAVMDVLANLMVNICRDNVQQANRNLVELVEQMADAECYNDLDGWRVNNADERKQKYVCDQVNAVKVMTWRVEDIEIEFDGEITAEEAHAKLKERIGVDMFRYIDFDTVAFGGEPALLTQQDELFLEA